MNDIFSLAEGMTLQYGKYTIIRMLSHGGFGVTYLARHNLLDIDVCIKEFFPSVWCNRDAFSYEISVSTTGNVDMVDRFMQKFIKEAKSIARLHHEGIVKILDIFEENGTAYYVMDFIEGQTLQQMVKDRGPLPLDEALGYIRQAAEALGYLHEENMNHLDVKPANMMINRKGKLTLIDFGVAKHYGEDGHQTTTTPMCISRGYSPIEQYDDGGVSQFSPVADIYSLGATLFYLLTGTTPPEATKLVANKLSIPDSVPGHVADAIHHAMQPIPAQRTSSTADFIAELTGFDSDAVANPSFIKSETFTPIESEHAHVSSESPKKPNTNKSDRNSGNKTVEKKRKPFIFSALGIILIILALGIVGAVSVYYVKYGMNDTSRKASTENVEKEKELGHKECATGDLLAQKDGKYFLFTEDEWQKVPYQYAFTKLGIIVNDGYCPPFYVALEDKENGREMTWNEAMSKYGEILPSDLRIKAMYNSEIKINNSFVAFGGDKFDYWHWGKEDSESVYYIGPCELPCCPQECSVREVNDLPSLD